MSVRLSARLSVSLCLWKQSACCVVALGRNKANSTSSTVRHMYAVAVAALTDQSAYLRVWSFGSQHNRGEITGRHLVDVCCDIGQCSLAPTSRPVAIQSNTNQLHSHVCPLYVYVSIERRYTASSSNCSHASCLRSVINSCERTNDDGTIGSSMHLHRLTLLITLIARQRLSGLYWTVNRPQQLSWHVTESGINADFRVRHASAFCGVISADL